MRVAICFSGQLRNVKSTYDISYQQHVLEANTDHQIDIFGHSWFDKSTVGTVYYAANRDPKYQPASAPIPTDIIQQLYDCYNPIQLRLEHQKQFDTKNYNERKLPDAVPSHGISRLYSLMRSVQLKALYELENDFMYDVVVCARYDLMFRAPFNFSLVKSPGVYHPGHSPFGFNVCYAMGDTHSMNVYANLYNQIDEVYATGINWCDELLALKYLQMNEIPIYDFNIPTNINRGGVL
jgi:hypothetical protein